jgi:hypothetical protein
MVLYLLAVNFTVTINDAVRCYMQLAARIAVSNLHKNTKKSFSET